MPVLGKFFSRSQGQREKPTIDHLDAYNTAEVLVGIGLRDYSNQNCEEEDKKSEEPERKANA